ncbi:hypothetical protein J2T55_002117 [Methylohalomonas lacus]|uniref:Porin n=1 Tax=Methylohalomonas lacus TaxID=398773 RepID=A0AAE3HKU1_9GAMM|nr:putative porin [Methylohalomonas lacus]MCS3904084.1 hypothetical protein [Methylohalomonas lacus]
MSITAAGNVPTARAAFARAMKYLSYLIGVFLVAITMPAQATWVLDEAGKLSLFGDLRGRFETDFDSRNESGAQRDDRNRLRYRIRLGLRHEPTEHWRLQFRARTSREASQQSSALTIKDLSGGTRDDFRMFPDQWFAEYKRSGHHAWLGRNSYPFWQANNQEMIWADNATLMGAFAGFETSGHDTRMGLRAGHFGLPDGMYDLGGRLTAAQATLSTTPAPAWRLRAAVGGLAINGTDRSRFLINGNGERDYRIGMLSAEARRELDHAGPAYISLGVDLLRNFENYKSDSEPITATFRDQRNGLVLSLLTGGPIEHAYGRRWEFGYVYAYLEKLALNAAYAQSDWVRWGSGGQTQSSDIKGHGISGRYWLRDDLDLRARLYLAESIATPQDGNRFRLDLNYRF